MFRRTESHVFACPSDDLWEVVRWASRLPEWHHYFADVSMRSAYDGSYAASEGDRVHQRMAGRFSWDSGGGVVTLTEPFGDDGRLRIEWWVRPHEQGAELRQQVEAHGAAARFAGAMAGAHFEADVVRLAQIVGVLATRRMKVVVAGGSGFLGQQLTADLITRGHEVVILTRRERPELPYEQVLWDGRTVGPWAEELAGDDVAVVNLAGELVDLRPTESNIRLLRDSRVDPTRALVEASRRHPVGRWLQASTTAIWSHGADAEIDETTPLPTGSAALPQMTGVASAWEDAASDANAASQTILRTSVVFDQDCPAFDRLAGLARVGAGGAIAGGAQWVSWIHVDDWLKAARAALGLEDVVLPSGVLAVTSPEPVRNRDLMRELRRRLAPRGIGLPAPAWLTRAGAVALRTDPALALTGRRVLPTRLLDAGFEFDYPRLDDALLEILT